MSRPARLWLTRWQRRWPELVSALAGFAWFLLAGGWRALPTSSLEWLRSDPWQHVMGWLYFRRSPWAFPLGRVEGFPWPLGTTIGFTDANPLVAIPLKLFSPILPLEFQFVGLWLAACFVLQGWFGARLAAAASERPLWRVLGGSLFALSPVLLARTGHDTLSAHWAVLALLALHLRRHDTVTEARREVRAGGAIALLMAFVHPYLAFIVLGLAVALILKAAVDAVFSWRGALARAALLVFAEAALFAIQGYFTSARSHGGGFGLFATDLLAFVNPTGASALLPDLPTRLEQAEGYAYLGAGGILLVLVAIGFLLAKRSVRPEHGPSGPQSIGWLVAPAQSKGALAPLLVVALLMAAFAVTPEVHLAGRVILDARATFKPLTWATGPLRSSGRFIWPLYYLVTAAALLVVARRLAARPRLAVGLLGGVLLLQVIDLAPRAVGSRFHSVPWRLHSATWSLARGGYDLLALYPPQINVEGSLRCRGELYGDDDHWAPLADVAYRQGMAVNSGQLARGATRLLDAACDSFVREVEAGRLRPRTVYVVHPSKLPDLKRASAVCGRIDGYDVCVSPKQRDAFRSALAHR